MFTSFIVKRKLQLLLLFVVAAAFVIMPFQKAHGTDSEDLSDELVGGLSVEFFGKSGIKVIGPANPPSFTNEDKNGILHSLSDYKGSVVVLNFWATWCPPCKEEMPSLEILQAKYEGKGLKVIAMNDYEDPKKVKKFLKKNNYELLVLLDPTGKVSESYQAPFLPTTFIIDRNGIALGEVVGYHDWASVDTLKFFEELLKVK